MNTADGRVAYLGGLDAVHGLSRIFNVIMAFNIMMAQNYSEFGNIRERKSDEIARSCTVKILEMRYIDASLVGSQPVTQTHHIL